MKIRLSFIDNQQIIDVIVAALVTAPFSNV
jgi:hypothetical protein